MPLVEPAAVEEAWLGPGNLPDTDKVTVWIGKAERELKRAEYDLNLDERIAAEAAETPPRTELADAAADVIVDMVIKKFQNPLGARSRSKGTGPFSSSLMFGGDTPGELEPTEKQLKKLRPVKAKSGQISLIPPGAGTRRVW